MTKNYSISGPSTEAAVDSLVDEVQLVRGIHTVDVDLENGLMTVSGEDFSGEEILQAIATAGYTLEDE